MLGKKVIAAGVAAALAIGGAASVQAAPGGFQGMPAFMSDGGGRFQDMGQRPELPEDFDDSERPELPEDFDESERPELPEDFDESERPELPEDFDESDRPELPEDFDESERPERPQGNMGNAPQNNFSNRQQGFGGQQNGSQMNNMNNRQGRVQEMGMGGMFRMDSRW